MWIYRMPLVPFALCYGGISTSVWSIRVVRFRNCCRHIAQLGTSEEKARQTVLIPTWNRIWSSSTLAQELKMCGAGPLIDQDSDPPPAHLNNESTSDSILEMFEDRFQGRTLTSFDTPHTIVRRTSGGLLPKAHWSLVEPG